MAINSNPIKEIAQSSGWQGSIGRKYAEPGTVRTLPVIDNTDPTSANVRTSIDCYVAGQYVGKGGKSFDIKQRYTIFISYGQRTQMQTMSQVRSAISSDFSDKYGAQFNISSVYVPALIAPMQKVPGVPKGGSQPIEFYLGSGNFRRMTSHERLRYDLGTERVRHDTTVRDIRDRYRYR